MCAVHGSCSSHSKAFSPQDLLAKAWASRDLEKHPEALKGVLKRLRKKLEEHDIPDLIENVKGRGFKLLAPSIDEVQPIA